jgi:hypothetical protein
MDPIMVEALYHHLLPQHSVSTKYWYKFLPLYKLPAIPTLLIEKSHT